MTRELDSLLDQYLSRLASGAAGPGDALPSDPTVASELEPLLRAAQVLMAIPKPVLPVETRARIESQVLSAAAANPHLRPATNPGFRIALPGLRLAYSDLAAVFLVAILTMAALIGASANALPGTFLYPLK
ncbi:MAG: hypothetical protein GWN58_09285, partial [Anaerolineae bacterium]|nr:hypothetical protein [Anaerolineae bacterium]